MIAKWVFGILLGDLTERVGEVEADRDDEVVAVLCLLLEVRDVVRARLGLEDLHLDAERFVSLDRMPS